MNLESTIKHTPEQFPGVSFVVRRLNAIQRAKRNASIAEARVEYDRLILEQEQLQIAYGLAERQPDGRSKLLPEEVRRAKVVALEPAKYGELARVAQRIDDLSNGVLAAASIRAGLISIDGYEIDSKAATVDSVLESGADDLLQVIYAACEDAAGLTPDQSKNSERPGSSTGPSNTEKTNGIAALASGPVPPGTSAESAATSQA